MASKSIERASFEDCMKQAEAELLEALLRHEEAPYLWNPADPSSEAYLADLEREFELEDWLGDEEIEERSQILFAQIDRCWSQPPMARLTLEESLYQRFANRAPQAWLSAIALRAQQVFSLNLSLSDQLIECVRPLLPNWEEDDLLLFARPFAYAMRGTDAEVVRPADWSELSEMEQARLSMAIAKSALVTLNDETED